MASIMPEGKHDVKFIVDGKVIGEAQSVDLFKEEHEVLQAIGVKMTKEELANFKKEWQASHHMGKVFGEQLDDFTEEEVNWLVKEKELKQKAQDTN